MLNPTTQGNTLEEIKLEKIQQKLFFLERVRWLIHFITLAGIILIGISWLDFIILLISYYLGMLIVSISSHRYFSHKSFKTSRIFQFLLGWLTCTTVQRGPIWWASVHRHHHKYSDTSKDFHSPMTGFWHSHMGWLTDPKIINIDYRNVKDLTRYPELLWLDKWFDIPIIMMILFLGLFGFYLEVNYPNLGVSPAEMIVYSFLGRTVLLWHATFSINSLMHLVGKQRFATGDTSKNSLLLSLVTVGDGWHNNHHRYPSSARNGFYWWEIDVSYYLIKLLALLGLIWDIKPVPQAVLEEGLKG
jgi:stearoyl-CoA desaturase (delta-9 desaturase)